MLSVWWEQTVWKQPNKWPNELSTEVTGEIESTSAALVTECGKCNWRPADDWLSRHRCRKPSPEFRSRSSERVVGVVVVVRVCVWVCIYTTSA